MKRIAVVLLVFLMLIIPSSVISANAMSKVSSDGLWRYDYYEITGYSKGYQILDYLGTDKNITLPESIDGIPIKSVSLSGNTSLVNLVIPKCYTCFETAAFSRCPNLKTVTFSREYEENEIDYFGSIMFAECKKLQKIVLPNKLPRELQYTRGADDEYEAVLLPDGIFQNCRNLTDVTLPDNLTEIDNCAFENCKSLTQIEIPEGVKYLNDGILDGCDSLTTIKLPSTIENITSNGVIPSTATVIVDANSEYVEQYIKEQPEVFKPSVIIIPEETNIMGDFNGDSNMDIKDVTILQEYLAGIIRYDISIKADMNGDGKVNICDATRMQKILAGIYVPQE
jgi:hypothetical protein